MLLFLNMLYRILLLLSSHTIVEEFEDTKRAIIIRISKNRQHNDQKKKYKRTNNYLQNIHISKDRVTRTPLKTGGELGCSGRVGSSCSTSGTHIRLLLPSHKILNEANMYRLFTLCLYLSCHSISYDKKRRVRIQLTNYKPTIFMYLSQTRICISNAICRGPLCVQ